MAPLPGLACRLSSFGAVLADVSAAPWAQLEPQALWRVEDGGQPDQRTWIRAGWEAGRLRLLFCVEATDPRAALTERGAPLYTEEVVEVFLDTEGDGEGYFELEVNPNNAVLDCCARRIRSGYRKDFRWRCADLETAVMRTEGGWAAELAIPFASLTSRIPQAGDQWRVNFTRIDRPKHKPRELSAWSPTGLAQFHVPQRFGCLRFV